MDIWPETFNVFPLPCESTLLSRYHSLVGSFRLMHIS